MTENTVSSGKVPTRSDQDLPTTRESNLYMSPAVDIYETKDGLTVLADVPGVDKDGLEISVEDKILTIRGRVSLLDRKQRVSEEFTMMDYFRQFRLTEEVDQSRIEASLDQGVLRLSLPKAEHAKPRRITVTSS